ncbi:MAG: 16S rRNA (guanine(527)-N(7))-methyltransferase RsmG [Bdellovibrionales bacterium]|nr:16S rRNA (guanine(527)-N(7))-methyltransferase RsmG [Bdellovibrionales bacterium]
MAIEVSSHTRTGNWRVREWFPDLSERTQLQLSGFHAELLTFNRAINLISSRTELDADLIHFSDAILGSRLVLKDFSGSEIYDFGSGNGLPGIVLAALAPSHRVHLVESDARKVEFLKHVVAKLGLRNAIIHLSRVEDLPADSVEAVVSRGFASIQKSLLLARKSCRVNAKYFHFKGEAWVREVTDIPSQMCRYWIPMHVADYSLPLGNAKLSLVATKKMA